MSHVYCSECGFLNPETANYCSRCGALLEKGDAAAETTQSFSADEVGEHEHDLLDGLEGPALVVRSGGGRAGEAFHPTGERTRIGRSPDCEIFLDDVTVSRNHAVLVERDGAFFVEDEGSLNGTFVNRHRIDKAELENGDEVQVGKYRMTFVEGIVHELVGVVEARSGSGCLRIGEVVRRLREEFPDISISKIRFLEDEGLLSPQRTPGRLPPILRARCRAARDDPAPPARRVPAAARDPRRADRSRGDRAQAP